MDDKAPREAVRGDMTMEEPRVTPQSWSCVDYIDAEHEGEKAPTEVSRAAKPASGDGVHVRFGNVDGAEGRATDGAGGCQERTVTGKTGKCGTINEMVLDSGEKVKEHKWYTGKRTNHGWPGTAEGKINTAKGMAGDLVSNLDSEEKSAVAGIWVASELRVVKACGSIQQQCYEHKCTGWL